MMADGEEHWREGGAGALDHLLERMSNDFTPQHDSQHFQPGFVPSATPPWTNSVHTSLGSPMPSLQPGHTSLSPQIPSLQTTHTDLGPQVPSMQASHSSIGPHIASLQSTTTVTGTAGLPPAPPQHSGPSTRSYSVSQDLFSEFDGGRSPLLRSSSDLGARMSNFHSQGCHFSNDIQLDGYMNSNLDARDGMLVGGQDSAFSYEVGRGASTTPPLPADPQVITTAPQQEFSFYSNENDRILEGKSASTISAKFSNFTASLGSLFSPFEPPFRSNFTNTPSEAHSSQPVTGTGTKPTVRSSSMAQSTSSVTSGFTTTNIKGTKPSYSDVLSKTPVQEYKLNPTNSTVNSKCSPGMVGVSGVNTCQPTTGQESKMRGPLTSNLKSSKSRTLSTSSSVNNNGVLNHTDKCREKENSHTCSRVGLDDFDLSEVGLKNCISEHFDWGEYNSCENDASYKTSSPTHAAKKVAARDHKKASPEKVTSDPTTQKPSNQLNNKVSSTQRKQMPKRTSYINNILNGASSSSLPGSNTPASSQPPSSSQPSPASSAPRSPISTENTDSCDRSRNLPSTKDERKLQESGSCKVPVRNKGPVNIRSRENPAKRGPVRKRKDPSFTQSEFVVHGWSVAVQWLAVAMQALVWLATLAADVVVMSSRLLGHLLVVAWAKVLHYLVLVKAQGHNCWARLLALFKKKDKEEKKTPGREKKVVKGLECNISLPTTGDEAMKRLLACKGKDPYSILGVTQDCTDDDIKKYYKRQAFLVHPDKNKQPGAEEAFKILAHAFEIIGEPERRSEYDTRLAEEVQLEGAWGELASLLTRLQEKLDEAANTIRCTNCNKRHRRVKLPRPIYAARHCAECQIHHAAREGDIWAESTMLGLRWRYYACMEGAVYDISDWAACQSDNLKHLQANTHSVQYRIVSGKKNPPSKNNTPEFPSDPDLEEFFNNLCKEKFGKSYASGGSQGAQSDMRKRKSKKKK